MSITASLSSPMPRTSIMRLITEPTYRSGEKVLALQVQSLCLYLKYKQIPLVSFVH